MLIRSLWPLVLIACIDQPVEISPRGGGPPAHRLSQLGLFEDAAAQRPAIGVVPYDVIAPLWSDGAAKARFVAVPEGAPLVFADDRWEVPDGSYFVKTFYAPRDARDPASGVQLLETRVLAFTGDDVAKATYVWNAEQTDAIASGGNLDLDVRWIDETGATRTRTHHVPGTSQCDVCHRGGDGGTALGIRTPELAVPGQLDRMMAAGVVDRAPPTSTTFVDPYGDGPLEARATSYLAMNCAHCHSPGGEAGSTGVDWRPEHVRDNLCRHTPEVAGADRVIVPGDPDASAMVTRMTSSNAFLRMPRGPNHIPDPAGVAMLRGWITSLAPTGCP